MSLKEKLRDFSGALTTATNHAPDSYPAWSSWTYETNMADLKELWAEILPMLKKDMDQAEFIDGKLQEAFAAYAAKDKETGQDAILAIYNLDVNKLR